MKLFKYLFLGFSMLISSINAADKPAGVVAADKGAALYYNMPTAILNQNRVLWVHSMSRLLKDYDIAKPSASLPLATASPDDHFEFLVTDQSSEARTKLGANVFLLQKASDPKATGPVLNGDEIRIVAIYAAAGHPEKAGSIPSGRIINVANTSRLGEHKISKGLTHYDVYISDPGFKKDRPNSAIFTIQSIDGKAGSMISAKELITLQNKEYARPLCALLDDGRWGAKFGEVCAVKIGKPDASAQFTVRLTDIDGDLDDTGRANLKKTLTDIIKSSLLTLSPMNKPGNTEFLFNPVLHGGRLRALFDTKWRLAEASAGYTIFDVNPAGGSVKMVFSPAQKSDDAAYVVIIGDEKNSKTRLVKGGKDLLVVDGTKTADAIFGDLTKPHSFWAKMDDKTFSMGKGSEVGKNEFLRYEEKDSESALLSFVGFAGSETALFTNIVVSSKEYFAKVKADADAATKATKDKADADAKAAKDKSDATAAAAKAADDAKSTRGRRHQHRRYTHR